MEYEEVKDIVHSYNNIFEQLNLQYVLVNHEDSKEEYKGEMWIYHEECQSPNDGYYMLWYLPTSDEINDFIKDSISYYISFVCDRYKKGIHVAVTKIVSHLTDTTGISLKINPDKFL